MNKKQLTSEEKRHLEKILDPIDRSMGKYRAILEYVKLNANIEYWEEVDGNGKLTKRRNAWIHLFLPEEVSKELKRYYSECVEYKKNDDPTENIDKMIKKIADRIFKDY